MTNRDINLMAPNTTTIPFTESDFDKAQSLNFTGNINSNSFKTIITFNLESDKSSQNCFYAYNVFPLFDNNYLTVALNKLPFNYRLFSQAGTYVNNALWNFALAPYQSLVTDTENNDSFLEARVVNINKIAELHSFLVQLKNKDVEESEISGMKELFLKVDELIDNNDILSIDDLIISFISLEFSFQFHISLLASTLKVKSLIKKRYLAYQNAVRLGEKIMSTEDVLLTLHGLE